MSRGLNSRSERGCSAWTIGGWAILVAVGIGLAWYGFIWSGRDRRQAAVRPSATAPAAGPATLLPSPTPLPTLPPTDTPPPTFTPVPTPIPPTATPAIPNVVAGADGANVRNGPGVNFTRIGYLDPGTQARVIGRYGDWWQVEYDGAPGWVFKDVATAYNADTVPQVQPPPSPTPVPPTATSVPTLAPTSAPAQPTATPGPPAEFRGLVPNKYWVEGAPGPFNANQNIWFNLDVTNTNADRLNFEAFGTWVQETGQFQKSWAKQEFKPGQHFTWRDHIEIPDAGTYNLWMRVCFTDGTCVNMMGPVTITVK